MAEGNQTFLGLKTKTLNAKDDPTHRLTGDIEEENQSRTNTKKFTSKTIQEKLKLRIDRAHGVSKNTSPE